MHRKKLNSCMIGSKPQHNPHWKSTTLRPDPSHPLQNTLKLSQVDPFCQIHSQMVEKSNPKLLKLIGNKEQNIQEIVKGFGCVCGCKMEFKNVVVLLMDKIYKLREERNSLRQELSFLTYTPRTQNNNKKYQDAATNTEQVMTLEQLQRHLATIKSEDKEEPIQIPSQGRLNTEDIEQIFKESQKLLLASSKLNQTNLLQTSSICQKQELPSIELTPIQTENNVLTEHNSNVDNKMKDIASFVQHNNINMKTLQNYIQKMHCAKELGRYEEDKRKRSLF